MEDPEKSFHNGTQVGVSTYPDDPLNIRTDTDESADEHHTRYGVGTSIQGDNGVFGASVTGDDLPFQTDVPVAEMALHSVSPVRAMGILLKTALQKVSIE